MTGIDKAISIAGGLTALSRLLPPGVTPQLIFEWRQAAHKAADGGQWSGRPSRISVERAVEVERALSGAVTAEELRPDKAEHFAYLRGTRV